MAYPIGSVSLVQIFDVNISTVCSPDNTSYQCKCEDQYGWPCDMCSMFGKCSNMINNTCGCINALPPNNTYCQPLSDVDACPTTTTPPPTPSPTTTTTAPTTTPTTTTTAPTTTHSTSGATTSSVTNSTTPVTNSTSAAPTTLNTTTTEHVTNSTIANTTVTDMTTPTATPATNSTSEAPTSTVTMTTPVTNTSVIPQNTTMNTTTLAPSTVQLTTNITTVISPATNATTSTTIPSMTSTITFTTTNTTNATTLHTTATPTVLSTSPNSSETTVTITVIPTTNSTTKTVTTTSVLTTTVPIITNTTTTAVPPTTQITTTPTLATNSTSTTPTTNTTTTTTKRPTPSSTTSTSTKPSTTTISATTTTTNAPIPPPVISTTPIKTTAATTTSSPPAITPTGTDVRLSVRLDLEFKSNYSVKESAAYKDLYDKVNPQVINTYKSIEGFIGASVTGFRRGSVLVDFTVRTSASEIDDKQMADANSNFETAISDVAKVLGFEVPELRSKKQITINFNELYIGERMILTFDPTDFNLENNVNVEWKFKGQVISPNNRYTIGSQSPFTLEIKNVNQNDAGEYQCTLKGQALVVTQKRTVESSNIKSAPNVQTKGAVFAKCEQGNTVPLECCVQSPFKVSWYEGPDRLNSVQGTTTDCIIYQYRMDSCITETTKTFTCKVENPDRFEKKASLTIFVQEIVCDDDEYGTGRIGDRSDGGCKEGETGEKIAVCLASGEWRLEEDTCIVTVINELLIESEGLTEEEVPEFSDDLSEQVKDNEEQITESSATISAIVNILNTIADVSKGVEEEVMQNVLDTVDVIISDEAKGSWNFLNTDEKQNSSSELLGSLEKLSDRLNGSFEINTQRIQLKRRTFKDSFEDELNSTVIINIPDTDFKETFITTILFSSLNNVMPPRTSAFNFSLYNQTSNETDIGDVINAAVLLVKIKEKVTNVTLSYDKRNTSLEVNPQCVFWNFSLLDNRGAWDDEGCFFVSDINDTVTCTCNHLTSFSILMSTDIPEAIKRLLDIMTYIGVGISMVSLLICLIIEGIVWRALTKNSTSFMRHVAIVNTALSLLIANICFIIGAAIAKNPKENPDEDYKVPVGPCSAATFFMHFFYLAMFFWMLVSSLLLLYRTVLVFSQMSKWTMFAIGLTVGYVCPLIIAVTTVAATAPSGGYIREDKACWLNWTETKAILALVIPALTIVVFNILVIIVVLYKMLRRRSGAQAEEKNALVVILRCVAILTPLFGLTWSLGIGTMVSPTNEGIHIAFAFFNSLQGFFILVFGTLFDAKIRSLILRKVPTLSSSSNRTRSTSAGLSSLSGLNIFSRLRGRNVYRVSRVENSNSSSSESRSFSNT